MVKFSHFDIEITQNGVPVKEYTDPDAEGQNTTVTRYVEVKEGQRFAVEITVDQRFSLAGYDGLLTQLSIDGQDVGAKIHHPTRLIQNHYTIDSVEDFGNQVDGRRMLNQFQFEETQHRNMQPGETLSTLREEFKDHGSIQVEISRVTGYTTQTPIAHDGPGDKKKVPKDIVKENASFTWASYNTVHTNQKASYFYVTHEEKSMANFRLKYRTIEALRDQGIVPALLITHPGEVTTILDDAEDANLRAELKRTQRENEELRKQIKQETAEEFREILERKRKVWTTDGPAEIDLTEERPAHRHKPNADDEVVEIDD